jgi:Flp pilus assembly protein TadG
MIMKIRSQVESASATKRRRSNSGSAMIELAISIPLLMIVLAGAVDFGAACYVAIEVANAARAGAQYGAQNSTTMVDSSGIILAAENEASNISTSCGTTAGKTCWVSGFPSASYGCECADGTGVKSGGAGCSCANGNQQVDFVLVTTQASYNPMIPWQGFGKTYTFNGVAKLRVGLQ